MKPVTLDEIAPLDDYGRLRPEYRRAVIAHKRRRRASVGVIARLAAWRRAAVRASALSP